MLSQQPPNPRLRRQAHRRQQSTPTGFDAAQLSSRIRPGDQQRSMHHPALVPQDFPTVSMTNNPGQPDPPQHFPSQVAQQQYHARSGPPPPPPPPPSAPPSISTPALSEAEFRQLQHQQLDAHIDLLIRQNQSRYEHGSTELEQHVHKIERSRSHPDKYQDMSLPGHERQHRPSSSRSAGFNDDRLQLHPNAHIPLQRPATPPKQSNFDYSPITPATTPFHGHQYQITHPTPSTARRHIPENGPDGGLTPGQLVAMQLSEDQVMSDPDATIKATRRPQATRVISFSEFFNDAHESSSGNGEMLPTPPATKEVHIARTVDIKAAGISLDDVPKLQLQPPSVLQSIPSSANFFDQVPFAESPQHGPLEDVAIFAPSPAHSHRTSVDFSNYSESPMRGPVSPKNVPIEELSLEATIEETGVSSEEVQSYIQEPTDDEAKWTCLFPQCGKMFGRKENIRSHVQTHLGDRQFKCVHCNKCFVRQHDLKRHSKIHSGVKPYPCVCGNSFARHDALTRHRQRGICNGGFEGIVKKTAKRGRPRKERPADDERLNKSAKTRARAQDRSYASSVSCTSESSWQGGSPESCSDPFTFSNEVEQLRLDLLQYDQASFPMEYFAHTPPYSPDGGSPGPEGEGALDDGQRATSEGARAAHAELQSQLGGVSTSQSSQQGSQAGSPPGLSHSSPPNSAQMMDFDFGLSNSGSSGESRVELPGTHDFDMFVNDGNGDELFGAQYEQALFHLDKLPAGQDDLFGDSLSI